MGHILPQAMAEPINFRAKLDLVAKLIVWQLVQTQLKSTLKEICYRRYKSSPKKKPQSQLTWGGVFKLAEERQEDAAAEHSV